MEHKQHGTLLFVITAKHPQNVTLQILNEAFCRDAEAFSEPSEKDLEWRNKMTTTDRPPSTTPTMLEEERHDRYATGKPFTCLPLEQSDCARIFDSSSCAYDSWRLSVPENTQRSLDYWSSDWKYRNDADVVAVRYNCSFTGWTSTSYSGASFIISAESTDRWVVFAESDQYRRFDESLLSFQCTCKH